MTGVLDRSFRQEFNESALMYKLDYTKAQTLQISNDAFFFIREEEPPLDEANLEEAYEVLNEFPFGFEIKDDWKTVEGTDLIEVTFVPYVEDKEDYDMYMHLCNGIQMRLKWLDKSRIKTWWFYEKTGISKHFEEYEIYSLKGGKCFSKGEYGKGNYCLYFLKHFRNKGQ